MAFSSWVRFHDQVKEKYLSIAPALWWGDDLDVRFYLLRKLTDLRQKKILDIGCNIGITLSFLDNSNELTGIDIDDYCVDTAQKLIPGARIDKASMDNLPYPDGFFDVVIMMCVFPYHEIMVLNDKDEFIKRTLYEAKRVLNNDGIIYLVTPNGGSIHYEGSIKAKYNEIYNYLNEAQFDFKIKGWNILSPIVPTFLTRRIKNRYRFIPAKFLCRFESVWNYLIDSMDNDIEKAKYFYVEMKK